MHRTMNMCPVIVSPNMTSHRKSAFAGTYRDRNVVKGTSELEDVGWGHALSDS